MELMELARQAATIAEQAGAAIRAEKHARVFQKEGDANYVTSMDIAMQEQILTALGKLLPEAHFFAEEQEENSLAPGDNWVVDPIDGTSNYMWDFHHSSVSIALVRDGRGVLGVVHNPYLNETFIGVRGKGAQCNGEAIHVSADPLSQGLVLFGTSPYYRDLTEHTFETAKALFLRCLDIRRLGSAALDLCYVACGRCAGFYEQRLSPWDFAAGAVILEEAGGKIAPLCGGPLDYGSPAGIIAANPASFEEMLGLLR